MFVTVIIPTFNRAPILLGLLNLLNDQTYPKEQFEVLVCSDGSTDNTREVVIEAELNYKVRYFNTGQPEKFTPAAARNLGVENSTGDILIFLDDDRYPVREFISEHVGEHKAAHPNDVIVHGPRIGYEVPYGCRDGTLPLSELKIDDWDLFSSNSKRFEVVPWEFAKTSNLSVTKSMIMKYGKFNERFQHYGYEDTEFVYRLRQNGVNVMYNEKAVNRHVHEIKIEEVERKLSEMVYTEQIIRDIHPSIQRLRVEQEMLKPCLLGLTKG